MIVFDVETGALPDNELFKVVGPFKKPEHPGEFDPESVKLGNLKDQQKIADKIAVAESSHKALVDSYDRDAADAEQAWRKEQRGKAALSATTGRVLAIGYYNDSWSTLYTLADHSEAELLEGFWEGYQENRRSNCSLVGHNIFKFDLPFLVQRSWLLGVDVPDSVLQFRGFDMRTFSDTMQVWTCGTTKFVGLDDLDKFFGGEGKPEGTTGADFARLFFGSEYERQQALDYLNNDLLMTWRVANRLGIS